MYAYMFLFSFHMRCKGCPALAYRQTAKILYFLLTLPFSCLLYTSISIQQCAEELLTYLQEYYNGHIQVLSGFSLGAQIAVSMLSMKPDLCEYAMIESAMMQPIKLQSWSAYAGIYTNALARRCV